MTTKDILKTLHSVFIKHKYQLSNSYVYSWESDFFSELSSGYHQEIEVKISRSDFLADFKKEDKHRILDHKHKGYSDNLHTFKGREISKVKYWTHKNILTERGARIWDDKNRVYKTERNELKEGEFTLEEIKINDVVESRPLYTHVNFRSVKCPNRFYYCCPEGLIKKEEVPDYAGLIYVKECGEITYEKKAPLIHRKKEDLTKVLLDKFYYLSLKIK